MPTFSNHPHYDWFCRLGSPKNLLTYDYQTGKDVSSQGVFHYSASQQKFANLAMRELIDLCAEFSPDFLTKTQGESTEEIHQKFEEFYRRITEGRQRIFIESATSQRDLELRIAALEAAAGMESYCLEEEAEIYQEYLACWQDLRYIYDVYLSPQSAATIIQDSGRYQKYWSQETGRNLTLKMVLNAVGIGYEGEEIELGGFVESGGKKFHGIAIYRDYEDGGNAQEVVNFYTNNLTKLALEEEDEAKAIKYAFAAAILRGYNCRSVIGACYGMEMSLRWIFAQRNWPQFNKAAGVYLDVEACCFEEDHDFEAQFESFLNRLSEQYQGFRQDQGFDKKQLNEVKKNILIDVPFELQNDDFAAYLVYARKYRDEDLPDILGCESVGEILKIAAQNGDAEFFQKIDEFSEWKSPVAKSLKENLKEEDLKEIKNFAKSYSDGLSSVVEKTLNSLPNWEKVLKKSSPVSLTAIPLSKNGKAKTI